MLCTGEHLAWLRRKQAPFAAWLSQLPSTLVLCDAADTWLAARQRRIKALSTGLHDYLQHQVDHPYLQRKLGRHHNQLRAVDYVVKIITQPPELRIPTAPNQPKPKFLKPHEVLVFFGAARVNNGGCVSKTMGGAPHMLLQRRLAPRCTRQLMDENKTSQTCPDCENERVIDR